jgi:microcystin-dependent protein
MPATTPKLILPYPLLADAADIEQAVKPLALKLDDTVSAAVPLIGEIRFVAVAATPPLWLPCDGAERSRITYSALWDAMRGGTSSSPWGNGNGSTTFNTPDVRGRTPVGAGAGTGLTARTAGQKVGTEAANMPSHSHGGVTGAADRSLAHVHNHPGAPFLVTYQDTGLAPDGGAQPGWFPNATVNQTGGTDHNIDHLHTVNYDGGGNGADGLPVTNLPPSIVIPAFIYAGV